MSESDLLSVSEDGSLLAICNSITLKLWETSSSILEHEFHPGDYLSSAITCLQFAPKYKRKKKKSLTTTSNEPSNVSIALGTLNGDILIYDVAEQAVKVQLNHDENSTVKSLRWLSPHILISLGRKKLIAWGRNKVKLWEILNGGECFCSLGQDQFVIGTTSLHFINYPPTKTCPYVVPAHKTSVKNLVPVFLKNENSASYVLSSARNDRFVYAWQVTDKRKEPVATFMVGDVVGNISCCLITDQCVGISVTTQKGILRYFHNHFNGPNNAKPLKYKGSLVIKTHSKKKSDSLIPILSTSFLSSSEILITYGSELFPRCERVSIDSLVDDVFLVREDPLHFPSSKKKSSLVKTVTPQLSSTTVHLTPSCIKPTEMKEVSKKRKMGEEASTTMPMETRLDALSLSKSLPSQLTNRPLDSYVHLLTQALHSEDSSLMNSILSKGEDEEIINNTMRRFPAAQVVPFLQYLQQVIVGKGLKNLTCINWIKSLLYHHMSHLSSIPHKKELLEPFYTVFAARTASMLAVTKLHSRINLLLMHVKNRHESVTQSSTVEQFPSLLHHKDDSSDDEDLMRLQMEGGPSESEDIWDDWTEEDEDEEKGKEEGRASSKRKFRQEDVVSVSDPEEETDVVNEEQSEADEEEAKDNGQLACPLSFEDEELNSDDEGDDEQSATAQQNDQSPSEDGDDLSD